jgi:hypothetical protein
MNIVWSRYHIFFGRELQGYNRVRWISKRDNVARCDLQRHLPLLSSRPRTSNGSIKNCILGRQGQRQRGVIDVEGITLTLRRSFTPQLMTRLAPTRIYPSPVIG